MKNIHLIKTIVLFIIFEGCSEEFSINAPYEDVYVLNCILRNNNSIQYAILSQNTFTENGLSPATISSAQNISGAEIEIISNNSVFVMRDTTIQLTDSEKSIINCYYVKNLTLNPGKTIKLEVTIPGGKKLESTVKVPYISYKTFSLAFPQIYQLGYQEKPSYNWTWSGNAEDNANILNLPQLEIYYQKNEAGTLIDKKIPIPLALHFNYDELGNLTPVNVELSFNNYCVTTLENVNKTMQGISGDDANKKNYIINKVVFSVISLDPDLSRFYSAYHTFAEDFTIKLRQTDFSNVEGGKGIFGIYYKFTQHLIIDRLYISSFGYQYDPMYKIN